MPEGTNALPARLSVCGPGVLLVLKIDDFAKAAWRQGRGAARRLEAAAANAFAAACRRTLRSGDRFAHDPGSELFLAALSAGTREGPPRSPALCRSAAERIAAAMSASIDVAISTGWEPFREISGPEALEATIERALLRGARERERYAFFAAVGHELRTPLTSIRGYLETVLDGDAGAPHARRFLETARSEALRMNRLLDGLFEFSLLDLSPLPGEQQIADVHATIERACRVVAPLALRRLQCVDYDGCASGFAAVSADALLQAVLNVLENAIKYGRDRGTVRVRVRAADGEVTIAVEDDGPGIAASELDGIFGFAVRGSRAASRPGAGIGLAIVKSIVERAGGQVRCGASSLGGARFELVLPAKAESAPESS